MTSTERNTISIGTHNGHFHADEALAVYLLRILPTYSRSSLLRTRDPNRLSECHTVVDVGGEYDPSRCRFDHHQRGFDVFFPGRTATKLSAAGLVYLHFGRDIIAQCTGLSLNAPEVKLLHEKLYDSFIEAFDANDTGVSAYDTVTLEKAGVEKKFDDKGFSIASVVNRFNYHYDDNDDGGGKNPDKSAEQEDQRFLLASKFVGEQFLAELKDKHRAWLPARTLVHSAFLSRFSLDPRGRIMALPYRPSGIPWSDHLHELEFPASSATITKPSGEFRENEADQPRSPPSTMSPQQRTDKVLYILLPESNDESAGHRVRAVPASPGSFESRKPLPAPWRGLRDQQLSDASGVSDCVFVHATGFIGGAKTYNAALALARNAVDWADE